MKLTGIVRAGQGAGALAWAASAGVVLTATAGGLIAGACAGQSMRPPSRLTTALGESAAIAAMACAMAAVLAIPAAAGLALSGARRRRVVLAVTALPLVTMPAVFGYAWVLAATRHGAWTASVLNFVGWPAWPAEVRTAWALANWLWPVAALGFAAAFERMGRAGYQLARLDAPTLTAIGRGALPAMRWPLLAALAGMFVLAATEGTVGPLLSATQVWGAEMRAEAQIAIASASPLSYIASRAWPMLAVVALGVLAASPGVRQMARWSAIDEVDAGVATANSGWWWGCLIAAAALGLFPLYVFATEFTRAGEVWASLVTARQTMGRDAAATALMAAVSFVAFCCVGLLVVGERGRAGGSPPIAIGGHPEQRGRARRSAVADGGHWGRWLRGGALVGLMATSVMPAELIGTALAALYIRLGSPTSWNLYDETPAVWAAAMICRFGFLPATVAWVTNARMPSELAAQAEAEGARAFERVAYLRVPYVLPAVLLSAAIATALAATEVSANLIVAPPRFVGGPLSVAVDSQMHYGRQSETVALSMVMMLPGIVAALLATGMWRGRRRVVQSSSLPPPALVALCVAAVFVGGGCDRRPTDERAVKLVFGRPGLSPGEFSYPRALAVSPVDGRVFVVDKSARVQRFDEDGTYETGWRMPDFKNGKPTGLTVDKDNHVWVADTHYARVMVFDRDGKELRRFGSYGEGPGQFVFPTAVAFDRDGNVYVGEYGGNDRISKFTPDGAYVSSFAGPDAGAASVERPTGLVFDENDELWLADACHHRICRYDRNGRLLTAFGRPGSGAGEFNYPYGLALEARGTILVADRGNNRIVRFKRDGQYVRSWGAPGRAVGQIAQPWAVAVGRGGIYCLDSWNNRVQVIDW